MKTKRAVSIFISFSILFCTLLPISAFVAAETDNTSAEPIIYLDGEQTEDGKLKNHGKIGNIDFVNAVIDNNGYKGDSVSYKGIAKDDYMAELRAEDHNGALDFKNTMTFAAWIKHTSNGTGKGNVYLFERDESYRVMLWYDGSVQIITATEDSQWYNPDKVFYSNPTVLMNEWTHVAAVYDGAKVVLYINGQNAGEKELSGDFLYNKTSSVYLCKASGEADSVGVGVDVDEFRVYDEALTEEEIRTLFKGEGGEEEPKHPNLTGKWGELGGNAVIDSVNGNNGIVNDTEKISYIKGPGGTDAFCIKGASVDIPDSEMLDGMDMMTVSAWVRLDKMPENDGYILVGKDNGAASYRLRVHNNGTLSFAVATENNEWYEDGTVIGTKETLEQNLWYYVSAVYNGTNIFIYVDGELWAKSSTPISGKIKNTDSDLCFGSQACGEELFASMNDVCLYNTAIEQSELKAQYDKHKETAVKTRFIDIGFDEGKAVDYSANELSVTEYGNPQYFEENGVSYVSLDGVKDALSVGSLPSSMNNLYAMSIRTKVRFNELDAGKKYAFISRDDAGVVDSTAFHSVIEYGKFYFAVKSDGAWYSGNFNRLAGEMPKTAEWLDLELRYYRGHLSYYINGELWASAFTGNGGSIDYSDLPIYIGLFHSQWGDNFLKADFSRIIVSNDFISDAIVPNSDEIGGEAILDELRKDISYNFLPELYIPNENQFTYNPVFNIDGKPADIKSFVISLAKPKDGVSFVDYNLIIDKTAEEGELELQLVYRYDQSIIKNISVPLVRFSTPSAQGVSIEGSGRVNKVLKTAYTYDGSKFPAKSVEYCWARSRSANGEYEIINNAKTATYTPTSSDENCYIKAGVKVITFLDSYIEEEVPANIIWSDSIRITEEQRNTGGGGRGSSSGSVFVSRPTELEEKPPVQKPIDENGNTRNDSPFQDIVGHWAYDDIVRLNQSGIVKGVSKDEFAPDISITRAEAAALIVRALKFEDINEIAFKDVDVEWYSDDIKKISAAHIMNGSDGYFRPNDKITREELAKIADNIRNMNRKEVAEEYSIDIFDDKSEISSWAEQAVSNMCAEKIMIGVDERNFEPKGFVTRAQMVTVLNRLLEKF